MKIAIGSVKFLNLYGEERYRKCKEFGFDAVDCRLLTDLTDEIYTYSEEKIIALHEAERALADEAGVALLQTHAPFAWPPQDTTEEERAKNLERMKFSIRCSAILGVKLWVVHPLMPMGHRDLTTGGAEVTREVNLEVFSRLLPTARECGITVCLENMPCPEFSISSPDEIREIIEAVNDEAFRMCLDAGHNHIYNKGVSAGDQVRAHRDLLRAIHVHDNNGKQDQHRLPYDGFVDWKDFAKALKEIDFAGPFTYETAPSSRLPIPFFEEQLRTMRALTDYILDV